MKLSALSECPLDRGYPASNGAVCCKFPVKIYNPIANPECDAGELDFLSPAECGHECIACEQGLCSRNAMAQLDDSKTFF